MHLDGGRDSASAAYASAAYAQSRASNEHDADMVAFSDAAMGRLSGIRATINMNRRRGCVHATRSECSQTACMAATSQDSWAS